MKRVSLIVLASVVAYAVIATNCMDRKPAPICPVPTQVNRDQNQIGGFEGVDLLVVIDDSGSMMQEQQILATGFFTLINSLVKPVTGPDWPYQPVENMRVAIVSSNLGLQYGADRSIEGFPYGDPNAVPSCTNITARGDNGVFKTAMKNTVNIESGQIKCGDDTQCPSGWTCGSGTCDSPSGNAELVNCHANTNGKTWLETSAASPNTNLALQVACSAELGKDGCGVEQQMEAAVRALSLNEVQKGFMKAEHLLAVLIVSDEEDCSIADRGLFATKEWLSGTRYDPDDPSKGLLNTACNLPKDNEDFLFDTSRYVTELTNLKGGMMNAVVFAAIVGVPTGPGCEGQGNDLGSCLGKDIMDMKIGVETNESGIKYKHFKPACERWADGADTNTDAPLTSARPGRRYVKVAQDFGDNGYVYSICNADWSPAMKDIAKVIASNIGTQCYPKRLEWTLLNAAVPEDNDLLNSHKEICAGKQCGVAKCDVVVTYRHPKDDDPTCPASFNLSETDKLRVVVEPDKDSSGNVTGFLLHCPLPKLPATLACSAELNNYYKSSSEVGWYYCENEIFDEETCQFGVELTTESKEVARGGIVSVQCLQEFSFEDENCQENTKDSCNDGEDNDGNGRFDCVDTIANPNHESAEKDGFHFADANCCPMDVDANNKCLVRQQALTNCGGDSPASIDACKAAATANGCTL